MSTLPADSRSGWRWSGVRRLGVQAEVGQAVAPGELIAKKVREKSHDSIPNADWIMVCFFSVCLQ